MKVKARSRKSWQRLNLKGRRLSCSPRGQQLWFGILLRQQTPHRVMIYTSMRASCRLKLTSVAVLLLSALAFGQADQPTAAQQPTSHQPTAKPPANPQPNVQQSVAS